MSVPNTDRDGWALALSDDFPIDVPLGSFPAMVSTNWAVYSNNTPDSTGHGRYYPSKVVSIKDGILNEDVHTENGVHMVVAILPRLSGIYGRYACRWRMDKMHNYKFVMLLWPNRNPVGANMEGEIDFPELNCDSGTVFGFVHHKNKLPPTQGYISMPIDATVWHTSVMEWSPNLIVFILDGMEIYRTEEGVPDTGMHLVLQTETATGGAPAPTDDVRGNIQFDWFAAWKYDVTARAPVKPRTISTVVASAVATGDIPLSVTVSADVLAVKFMVDDVEIGYDAVPPFTRFLHSAAFSNGPHNLWAKGRDAAGWFNGPKRILNINNHWNLVAPEVATGKVVLAIDQQYSWIKMVKWVIGNIEIGSDVTTPFGVVWDSTKIANGVYDIYAKVNGQSWVNGPKQKITVSN